MGSSAWPPLLPLPVAKVQDRRRRCAEFLGDAGKGRNARFRASVTQPQQRLKLRCPSTAGQRHGAARPLGCGASMEAADEDQRRQRQWQSSLAVASLAGSVGSHAAAGLFQPPCSGVDALSLSCLPLLPLPWEVFGRSREEVERIGATFSTNAKLLMHALSGVCWAEAACAVIKLLRNDTPSALIAAALAALGLQAAAPGGQRFLPSFIVLSFCNGTMQVLLNAELVAGLQLSWRTLVSLKLANLATLASPVLMFAGLALAWNLHLELRQSSVARLAVTVRPVDAAAQLPQVAGGLGDVGEDGLEAGQAGSRPTRHEYRPFTGERFRLDSVKM